MKISFYHLGTNEKLLRAELWIENLSGGLWGKAIFTGY